MLEGEISIHAPAWGATLLYSSRTGRRSDFNPRTRMGCDVGFIMDINRIPWDFNPRTRMGCDDGSLAVYPSEGYNFNPRTRMGCDEITKLDIFGRANISIHAPAWGATALGLQVSFKILPFQSTHPHGVRRLVFLLPHQQLIISIHAPAWGATGPAGSCLMMTTISIHAPAWGATRLAAQVAKLLLVFQSTHPHGVRHFRRNR